MKTSDLKRTRYIFILTVVSLLGCSSPPSQSTPERYPSGFGPPTPQTDGAWGPMVFLKDMTQVFQGDHLQPRPLTGWFVTPIHANLLNNGFVLISGWSRSQEEFCPDLHGRQNGESFLISPGNLEPGQPPIFGVTPIWEQPAVPGDVLYCSGHAPLMDGRILFSGGARYQFLDVGAKQQEFGLNYERLYDPPHASFLRVPQTSPNGPHPTAQELQTDWSWYQQGMMWYPTNTRLPDGNILVAGGFSRQSGNYNPSISNRGLSIFNYPAFLAGNNPWAVWVSDENSSPSLDLGQYDYVHAFLLPQPIPAARANGIDRQVALFGGYNGSFTFLSLDTRVPENQRLTGIPGASRPTSFGGFPKSADSTAVLTSTGEIMMMGGGSTTQDASRIDVYTPQTGAWRSINTGITRIRPASLLLPDGTVLILDGEGMWSPNATWGDRRQPTIFNPRTNSVTNLAPWSNDPNDRGYHNMALLLKDGRILVGGGRTLVTNSAGVQQYRIGCERTDMRIFSPPYLFKGPRPVIQGMTEPALMNLNGAPLVFNYTGAQIAPQGGALLMALGAETHHFDQNQRFVALNYTAVGGRIQVSPPVNGYAAPPGEYNLFLLSDQGVPSVGFSVNVR